MSRARKPRPAPMPAPQPLGPPGRYDHPAAVAVVGLMKRRAVLTKCCGSVVLPGVLERLYMARKMGEEARKVEREALRRAVRELEGAGYTWAASLVRGMARKVRVRA